VARRRRDHRKTLSENIPQEFQNKEEKPFLIAHWDGKLMHDVTNTGKN
jgi:hypothetical protein